MAMRRRPQRPAGAPRYRRSLWLSLSSLSHFLRTRVTAHASRLSVRALAGMRWHTGCHARTSCTSMAHVHRGAQWRAVCTSYLSNDERLPAHPWMPIMLTLHSTVLLHGSSVAEVSLGGAHWEPLPSDHTMPHAARVGRSVVVRQLMEVRRRCNLLCLSLTWSTRTRLR